MRNTQSSLENLERQVAQIAKSLAERPSGSLPSNTEVNPRETMKAITLRSGKEVATPQEKVSKNSGEKNPANGNDGTSSKDEVENEEVEEKAKEAGKEVIPEYIPRIPYPAKLKKDRQDEQFKKFLEMFKTLQINLPFVEALSQMPKYAKFLKELLTNKRKLEEVSSVTLSEGCSAVLQNKLPRKEKDPGSFIIPCTIGGLCDEKALADLGASINLMPYKICQRLGLGEPKPTKMTLQLADRSIRHPRGIIEDVLVKVDKLIFPVDFVILDLEDIVEVPLILGRPFLATSQALIDVKDGKMVLRAGEEEVIFKLQEALKHPMDFDDKCYFLDVTDGCVEDYIQDTFLKDPLEELLGNEEIEEELNAIEPPPPQDEELPKVKEKWWRRITMKRKRKKKTPPASLSPSPSTITTTTTKAKAIYSPTRSVVDFGETDFISSMCRRALGSLPNSPESMKLRLFEPP